MKYLKVNQVKARVHQNDKQITPAALHALDVKIEHYLMRICQSFNGHKKRVTAEQINLFKL
jgi:hypothetical protein